MNDNISLSSFFINDVHTIHHDITPSSKEIKWHIHLISSDIELHSCYIMNCNLRVRQKDAAYIRECGYDRGQNFGQKSMN